MKHSNPFFVVRKSKIHGKGAFAVKKIRAGTRIIEYTGEVIDEKEFIKRCGEERDILLFFHAGKNKVIDAMYGGSSAELINHSCDGNCESDVKKGKVFIVAIKTIQPGEELTYDYGVTIGGSISKNDVLESICKCGSKNCTGLMLSLSREQKKKYGEKIKKWMVK